MRLTQHIANKLAKKEKCNALVDLIKNTRLKNLLIEQWIEQAQTTESDGDMSSCKRAFQKRMTSNMSCN